MKLNRLAALAALGVLVAISAAQDVKLGSPAPKLEFAKWIKGKEFNSFEPGKIYVMEFWATWCGPCKEAMPHLTKLAKKYDKVTFTGVSVFENQEESGFMDRVTKFVKDNGTNMGYNVAADDTKMFMAKNWMEAAGLGAIPATFIVKDNQVAWIGHPMAVEPVLEQMIAGKYDMAAEAKKMADAKAQSEKIAKIMTPIGQAASEGDFEKAVKLADKAITENPDMREDLSMLKFNLMLAGGDANMGTFAKELADGLFKDDALRLNEIAWSIIDEGEDIPRRDFPAAMAVAERAVAASKGEDWMILDTLALAQFKNNLFKKAYESQEKAVKLMEKDKEADPETKKEVLARLEKFKKAAAGS